MRYINRPHKDPLSQRSMNIRNGLLFPGFTLFFLKFEEFLFCYLKKRLYNILIGLNRLKLQTRYDDLI